MLGHSVNIPDESRMPSPVKQYMFKGGLSHNDVDKLIQSAFKRHGGEAAVANELSLVKLTAMLCKTLGMEVLLAQIETAVSVSRLYQHGWVDRTKYTTWFLDNFFRVSLIRITMWLCTGLLLRTVLERSQ